MFAPSRVSLLLQLAALLFSPGIIEAGGIILEKANPWDATVTSVEPFSERLPASDWESGYRSYFRGRDGRRFGVENSRIAKLVIFLDPADLTDILDEAAIAKLTSERARLSDVAKKFPVARSFLLAQTSLLDDQIAKFRAGHRKLNGKSLSPQQYRDYTIEQERMALEAKAAQEKRLAEQRAAEEKRLAEQRAVEEKRLTELKAAEEKRLAEERAEKERRQREEEQRREAIRNAKENAVAKKGEDS